MKNKFQDTHHHIPSSSKESEQRIKLYRQAWLEGKLNINSERLAEKMIDFEKQFDFSFAGAHTKLTDNNHQ